MSLCYVVLCLCCVSVCLSVLAGWLAGCAVAPALLGLQRHGTACPLHVFAVAHSIMRASSPASRHCRKRKFYAILFVPLGMRAMSKEMKNKNKIEIEIKKFFKLIVLNIFFRIVLNTIYFLTR